MSCIGQMAGSKADSIRTNLPCVSLPGHEAAAGVDVPHADVSATGGAEQQGVRVVAQGRHLHIADLSWRFRPLRLQRAKRSRQSSRHSASGAGGLEDGQPCLDLVIHVSAGSLERVRGTSLPFRPPSTGCPCTSGAIFRSFDLVFNPYEVCPHLTSLSCLTPTLQLGASGQLTSCSWRP